MALSGMKYLKFIKSVVMIAAGLLLFENSATASSYESTPTIIQVNKNQQKDTVGFNLVKDIYALFYKCILEGTIPLYESHLKKTKISAQALQNIEKQHEVSFQDCEDLFIYELWELYKKDFEFQVLGFAFYQRTEGSTLNFGYVDAADAKSILGSSPISTTINGPHYLGMWDAIMSKAYNFNLVKFGNIDFIKNPQMAFNLKDQIFGNKKIQTNQTVIPQTKEIEYYVIPGLEENTPSYWLCRAIEDYYAENRNEYFNNTQTPVVSHLDIRTPLNVTRIEITENWNRSSDGNIIYQPKSIRVFINDKPMNEMSMKDFEEMKLLVQFKPFDEFLKEKTFKFNIKRVNHDPIYSFEADEIKTALYTKDWNKIRYTPPNLLQDNNR
ncbi:MAG: hypothetical protein H6607_12860 [Flavobacteriales bacterium]|nr:hypothetical protein [Flavobacteriales bacterium]